MQGDARNSTEAMQAIIKDCYRQHKELCLQCNLGLPCSSVGVLEHYAYLAFACPTAQQLSEHKVIIAELEKVGYVL